MPYNPYDTSSGGDPKGRVQNRVGFESQRYQNQQGPMVNEFARNYGRGAEANYGDYTDIMDRYRGIASGGAAGTGGGGGATGFAPSTIGYNDPFNSYAGFQEFGKTGGYSRDDIANMRSRGVSPIRAAYSNANREVGRQRSLQGGYSPNAIAAQVKMAREQGQGAADATQNVEAGLAEARNKGRLSGLSGMSDIEKQRLAADLEVAKFNAQAQMSAGASSSAAGAANQADQLRALQGMTSLYGATPGMANTFGNQLLQGVGQGGQMGLGYIQGEGLAGQQTGQFDQTLGRAKGLYELGSTIAYPWLNNDDQQKKQQPNWGGITPDYGDMGQQQQTDPWYV